MKNLIYQARGYTDIYDEETTELNRVEILACIERPYSEENIDIAKTESYNGEYTIVDDDVEESAEPTPEERIAELEEALEMLLNGVVE